MTEDVIRLHIGGKEAKNGWKILNIQPGPHVDYVGTCVNLEQFSDSSVDEIYASHVLEHLGFRHELPTALRGFWRILNPGGVLKISVPDFERLCAMFAHPSMPRDQKFSVMMHMFGAQADEHDFHKVGLTWDFLAQFLKQAGFDNVKRVEEFCLFNDFSSFRRFGALISLNVEARK